MITFYEFLQEKNNISNNFIFKIKNEIYNKINLFLTWSQSINDETELQEIKGNLADLKRTLESYNDDLNNIIKSKITLFNYNRLFINIINNINKIQSNIFNINNNISKLNKNLEIFSQFIQSKISLK